MQKQEEDVTVVLAERAGVGKVTVCGCGVVSLHLGGVTLRLPARALLQVEQLLEAALDQMCELTAAVADRTAVVH